ncbi:MAG: AbrB family transcriptional regulator, partial [Pseudomonadota bacterium]
IGVTTGANVTRETLATAWQWPVAIAALIASVAIITLVTRAVLRRVYRYDAETALLASSPGHLSYILGLSLDTKSDISKLSIIQSIRVLFLTVAVPFIVVGLNGDVVHTLTPNTPAITMTPATLIATLAVSVTCGFLFKRLRIPAAFLLAGMAMSSFGHLSDFGPGLVPDWLSLSAFLVMGTLIGTRFGDVSYAKLKDALSASASVTFIAITVSAFAALLVSLVIDVPLTHILIAFAPGGLEAMAAMAILLDANPAFVAAHHVLRIVFLTFFVPALLARLKTLA